ncbi:hypothetical protein, partial [Myxococcus sp. AM009]
MRQLGLRERARISSVLQAAPHLEDLPLSSHTSPGHTLPSASHGLLGGPASPGNSGRFGHLTGGLPGGLLTT